MADQSRETDLRLALSRRAPLASFRTIRLIVWLACAFILLLAVLVMRSRGLWSPDELRYAQIVQGMRGGTDLFVLRLWDNIYTEKPPLFFWLVRVVVPLMGGVSLASLLTPIVIASFVLIWLVGRIAWRWYGFGTSMAAIVVLATLPLFLLLSSIGRMDMLLALFVSMGVYAFHRGYAEGLALYRLMAFLSMGLGLLSKGPFGVVFPLAVAATALYMTGKWRRLWCRETLYGFAILLAVTACWLVPAIYFVGGDFLGALIGRQLYERAFAGLDHGEPTYFYAWVLPIILLPWALFLIPALRAAWSRWREQASECDLWLICWLAVPLVVLTLVREKLPVYLLPAMPPIALLIGRYWNDLFVAGEVSTRFRLRVRSLFVVGAILGVAALTASVSIARMPAGPDLRRLGQLFQVTPNDEIAWLMLDPLTLCRGGSLLLFLAIAGWFSTRARSRRGIGWTFGTLAIIAPCGQLFMILALMPALDASQSWRAVVAAIDAARNTGEPVATYGLRPFAAYYTHRDIRWFRKHHSLGEFVQKNRVIWCAAREQQLDEIQRCCIIEDQVDRRFPSPSGPVVMLRLRPIAIASGIAQDPRENKLSKLPTKGATAAR